MQVVPLISIYVAGDISTSKSLSGSVYVMQCPTGQVAVSRAHLSACRGKGAFISE